MTSRLDEQAALALLHYDPRWLEYGLIDAETLQLQVDHYYSTGGSSLEHYRYAAFQYILASHSTLSDEQILQYIELARLDEDAAGMAQAALCDLIQWRKLSAEQFDWLSLHSEFATPRFQKLIVRRRLIEALNSEAPSAEDFAHCLASNDAIVHRYLVDHVTLTRAQLQDLAEFGASRTVRNIAKDRLRRKGIG